MEVIAPTGVKIYNVSAGKTLPEWMEEKKKKSLKRNPAYQRRLELIQHFDFPTAGSRLKLTPDQNFLIATGMYPPQMRVFELSELTMKFKRHLDCEVIDFQILSEDYSKLAFLRADRTLEFHAKFGTYYKVRIPKAGRDLMFHHGTCDLYAVGSTHEIYRMNLEQGRFLKPFESSSPAINCCGVNPAYGWIGFGGADGTFELWDPRERKRVSALRIDGRMLNTYDVFSGGGSAQPEITALRWHNEGLSLGLGTNTGHVLLYDMRSNIPIKVKDHQFDTPIVDIKFHEQSNNVISACKKIVRIWDKDTGNNFAHIEPNVDINDVCVIPKTGMVFLAAEQTKMNVYYIPELGRAPSWCSFLDNLTEELEEDTTQQEYQDYKFVTRDELERLGVTRLVGTPYLRAYMHGYYMDYRLYSKIRAIARPDEYKEYIKDKIKQKMEEKRASRISVRKIAAPKVNRDFVSQISRPEVLTDERFSRMWTDPTMKIDMESDAFKRVKSMKRRVPNDIETEFELVDDDGEGPADTEQFERPDISDDEDDGARRRRAPSKSSAFESDDEGGDGDEDDRGLYKAVKQLEKEKQQSKTRRPAAGAPESDDDNVSEEDASSNKKRKFQVFEAKDDTSIFKSKEDAKKRKIGMSMERRLAEQGPIQQKSRVGSGALSMTFVPNDVKAAKQKARDDKIERRVRNKERRAMSFKKK